MKSTFLQLEKKINHILSPKHRLGNEKKINRLLIRSANWIGDAIMTTPAVRAIRKNFPGAEITMLAKPWVAPVFENSPYIDKVLIYDATGRHKGFAGKFRLARDLKSYRFDAAILFQNAFEAALITFLAEIPVRIGYDTDGRTPLLTHAVPCTKEMKQVHQVDYYLGILRGAGLQTDGNELHLAISRKDRSRAGEILRGFGISEKEPLLGINPGATYGSAKRWFPERYSELCRRLRNILPFRILVFGGPGEELLGQQICETVGKNCVNLCGKTSLQEAVALIERCRLFITNDSGLMHIAAALDVSQIAIFGSTDHLTTSPASEKSLVVRVPTPCSPCLKPDCPADHRCMKAVTADMVYEMAEEVLSIGERLEVRGQGSEEFAHPEPLTSNPEPLNILIVKLSAIGDVLHTLPALNALREHFPDARITWLVEEAAYPLIAGHRALNRVLLSKRKRWIKDLFGPSRKETIGEICRFIRDLRDTRYDLIFDFQALLKSGVLVALARGKRKIGYDKGMAHDEHSYLFLNERMPPVKMNIHALLRNLMLLEAVGIYSKEIAYDVPVQDADRKSIDALLEKQGVKNSRLLIALNPVAKWETKLWSEDKFSRLADRLIEEYDVTVIFTGGTEDRESVERMISGMLSPKKQENVLNFAGETSLKMLAALYEKTAFLISTDTGPMHLAAAMGKPVIAIFGPTAPCRTGPFGSGHQIIRAGLPCSPCFKRQCRTTACMRQISVLDVLDAVKKMTVVQKQ